MPDTLTPGRCAQIRLQGNALSLRLGSSGQAEGRTVQDAPPHRWDSGPHERAKLRFRVHDHDVLGGCGAGVIAVATVTAGTHILFATS